MSEQVIQPTADDPVSIESERAVSALFARRRHTVGRDDPIAPSWLDVARVELPVEAVT